ncbi:MAG: TlpA family protein disulfide reductase [Pseudomonadota bacterium]
MRRLLRGLCLWLALSAGPAWADAPKPFTVATPAALQQRFAGQPYLLAFWSIDCPHCQGELEGFARLLRERPKLPLVLVAVDAPAQAPQVAARLAELGLSDADNWQFAEARPERLRFAVDRQWRGELPRSYLFDAAHRRQAVSGALSEAAVRRWLETLPD